jgi:hypothetical protein
MRSLALAVALSAAPAFAEPSLLDKGSDDSRVGRVAAELGAAILGAALPNLLWIPFAAFNSPDFPLLFVVAMALEPLAASTGAWLVHRAMGGKGMWGAGMVGTVLGMVAAGTFTGLTWAIVGFNHAFYPATAAAAGILFTLAITTVGLEVSHDRGVDIDGGIVPMPGGGGGFVRVRF